MLPSFSFDQLERMAKSIAASGIMGVKRIEDAMTLMLLAQAEGRHPVVALRDYHLVEGRPALKADAMLARFHEAGGRVEWEELSDRRVAATFAHPSSSPIKIEWTMATATQAGLSERANWKKYPRAMLRSRVVSEGVRTALPSVIVGIYTPEELADGDIELKDVTPRGEPPPAKTIVVDKVTGEVLNAELAPVPAPAPASGLPENHVLDHLAAIDSAADDGELRRVFGVAYNAAWNAEDFDALKKFDAAKRKTKDRLAGVTA